MKIGILSGTFDPIHEGHTRFAISAAKELGLDEVVMLVELNPRRKSNVTTYKHRLEMVHLACEADKHLVTNELTIQEEGKTHTVAGTMKALKEHFEKGDEFTLLMGGDLFQTVPHWDGVEDLVDEVSFGIGLRTEDDGELAVNLARDIGAKVKLLASELPKSSSSNIRNNMNSGENPVDIDKRVLKYIQEHKLYDGKGSPAQDPSF